MRFPAFFLLLAAAVFALMGTARAEPRVALVIGNANYGGDLGVLPNPANDARLMAKTLQGIGFTVIAVVDADQNQMKRAIADFGEKLAAAGSGSTGLFFYAGHGLQVGGANYLIPIHAKIQREPDVDIEAVPADLVLKQMDFAGSAVNIVILDACRNNPLSRGFRSMTRGLAEINVKPRGSFIAYSTAPGDVADDGKGANSPYTTALAATITEPGKSLNDVFQEVRGRVLAATDQKQVPWDSSSLTAPYFFVPAAPAPAVAAPAPAPALGGAVDPKAIELAFWDSIKASTSAEDYQAYLAKYPDGDFAPLAKIRLKELGGTAAHTPNPEPTAPTAKVAAPSPPASDQTPAAVTPAPLPQIVDTTAQLYARDKSRLRAAPAADAAIVARLAADTPLNATGRSADGRWWRVSLADGRSGFVAASAVGPAPARQGATGPQPDPHTSNAAPAGKDVDLCKSDADAAAADRAAACRRLLDAGIADATDRYNANLTLADALTTLGKSDEAIRFYRAAIDIDPNYFSAYYGIGLIHLDGGRYAEARAAFDKAAALNPKDDASIYKRGVALGDLGEIDGAIADVTRALALKPDQSGYLDQLAALHLAKGDTAAAVADIDKAVAVDPSYWGGSALITYYIGGRFDDVATMADKAIKELPDYPYFWLWKALAQRARGNQAAADTTLADGLKAFGKPDWPAPLLGYFAGTVSEERMRALARSNDRKVQSERLCEIDFYVGERAYLAGDKAAARAAMARAAGSRIYYYLEYAAAQARLAALNQ